MGVVISECEKAILTVQGRLVNDAQRPLAGALEATADALAASDLDVPEDVMGTALREDDAVRSAKPRDGVVAGH